MKDATINKKYIRDPVNIRELTSTEPPVTSEPSYWSIHEQLLILPSSIILYI